MSRKIIRIILSLALALTTFSGCSSSPSSVPSSQTDTSVAKSEAKPEEKPETGDKVRPAEPIKVGVTCPYSGFVAVMGENLMKGIELGIEVEGRQDDIKLLIEDTKLEAELAVTKLDSLTQKDNCKILIGSITGHEGDAQAEWVKKNPDVLFMPGFSAPQDMTMRNASPNMVRAGWTADQVMFNFGEYVVKEMGYKKIISIGADYSYPWGQAAGFARGFLENGGEEIEYIWYPEGNLDFSSIMGKLQGMAGEYDAVYLNDGGAPVISFWKAWEQYGIDKIYPQLIGGTNVADTNVITEVSEGFIGVKSAGHYVDGNPIEANKEFIKLYTDKFGTSPDAVSVQGYDTIRCIIKGLDEVGWKTDDVGAIIDAITNLKILDSPRGEFYFDEFNNAVQNVYIKEVVSNNDVMETQIVKTFENVTQFGPYDSLKEEYMSMPADARDYPYTTKDAYMVDIEKYMGKAYVEDLIKNDGWK